MADDIAQWLEGLGLGQYAQAFAENDIDLEILPRLSEEDLEKLGLSLGHRRKLQSAIEAVSVDEPSARLAAPPEQEPEPHPPEAERRQLTVMFCDLVGSTALSSQLDPEDMRDVIRSYQDACAGVVTRYDGFVAKYMGDGVLVYFGYPTAHEDDAERAINTGLEIVEAVSELPDDVAVRIGIATGTVTVGDIVGEGASQEAAIVGEAPNLAARLQELAAPDTVVIGGTTHALSGGLYECRDLGERDLKGFPEPIRAWSVIRPVRAESRFDVTRTAGLTPLVGRAEELDILLRRWRRAKQGEGQIALISGEPGIGKSRLVHALQERIVQDPHTPVRLQCSPFHTNSALYPMIDYLERAAGLKPDDDTGSKLDKLEALLRLSGDRIEDAAPLMAELLSITTESRYSPLKISPQEKKHRTLHTINTRLVALADQRPILVVLEDAHWIDPTTLELMELIIESATQAAILVVISYRPEFTSPWVGRPRVTLLALNRLDHESCALMVKEVAASRTLPDEIRRQIIARTDGVPLFVEELTRSILESGPQDATRGSRDAVGSKTSMEIPATLMDSLEARLDRLGPAKDVAQLGATIGRTFDYDLLAKVSPQSEGELLRALDGLVDSELIFRRGEPPVATYTFKHALIQDAAYGSLLRGRREEAHSRIAHTLEQSLGQGRSTAPEIIAHHYTAARQFEPAVDFWLKAGEAAFNRSALQEAVAHLTTGVDVNERLPEGPTRTSSEEALQATLGVTFRAAKGPGHEDGERALARAYELGQGTGASPYRFPVLFGLWQVHYARAQYHQADREAAELLDLAEADGERQELLAANWARGMSLALMGENAASLQCFDKMRDLHDLEADASLAFRYFIEFGVGMCFGALMPLFALGYPDQALERAHEAISRGRAQLPVHLGGSLNYGGQIPICRGDAPTVLEWAEECLGFAERLGLEFHIGFAKVNRGWAYARLGRAEEGITEIRDGIPKWRASGFESWAARHLILLSEVSIEAGRLEDAIALSDEALISIRETGERQFESYALIAKGDALRAMDREGEAARCFLDAIDVAHSQSAKSWELRAATRLARLWQSQDKTTDARDLLAPVYGWFTEGFDTADLKEAKALLDELG